MFEIYEVYLKCCRIRQDTINQATFAKVITEYSQVEFRNERGSMMALMTWQLNYDPTMTNISDKVQVRFTHKGK
jgi:hypothetical protein